MVVFICSGGYGVWGDEDDGVVVDFRESGVKMTIEMLYDLIGVRGGKITIIPIMCLA
ncbi:hypothetical protein Hanom_Chr02g00158081 [Helianthus anomalus]